MTIITNCPICKNDFMHDPTWDSYLYFSKKILKKIKKSLNNDLHGNKKFPVCQKCYEKYNINSK
jgi:hypothetical protein